MLKKYSVEIKWGVIFAVAGILWMVIEKMTGLHDVNIDKHPTFTWIFAIPAFLMYFLALREKREKVYNGSMSWKQGFMTGLIMAVVVALISPFSQYLIHTVISPDFFENAINSGVEMGKGTREEISKMMNLKSYMTISPIMTIVMGVVTSAIVALFTKKA